jgi:lipoate-protein ligase B
VDDSASLTYKISVLLLGIALRSAIWLAWKVYGMDLNIIDWGMTRYADGLARQMVLVAKRKAGAVADTLVFTEHHPVYTMGVRPGADRHLVWTEALLNQNGIETVKTNRGGDITYHGPGQLVGYPIVDWSGQKDLHKYLRLLEDLLIQTVANWGLNASRRDGKTGIWVDDRKLAAIGVAVRSWITYHGFALNVNTDLNHFSGIIPCGITDGTVTSLERELGGDCPTMAEVKQTLSLEFTENFGKALSYGNA